MEEWEGEKKEAGRRDGGVGAMGIGDVPSDEEPDEEGDMEGGGMLEREESSSFLEEWLYILTCFLREDGSVYRLPQPGWRHS